MDWLSRLFEMMPVRGRLDLRCSYGAPWRIDQGPGEANEIPYHAVLGGSALLEDPAGGKAAAAEGRRHPSASRQPPARHARRQRGRARCRPESRVTSTSRSARTPAAASGSICSAAILRLRLRTTGCCAAICRRAWSCMPALTGQKETAAQLAGLVSLMRSESADDHLGGRAMLNALSTAMFALVLRLASETETRRGLLALAGHPRLAPAVAALFNEPARHGRCPSLRGCATCRGRHSPANSRRSSDDRPAIF